MCFCSAMLCCGQRIITTFAGSDITYPNTPLPANSASFGQLVSVAIGPSGDVYFVSESRSLILRLDPATNSVAIVAGIGIGGYSGDGGPATKAELNNPQGIAFDAAGNLFVADNRNNVVRKIDTQGTITTFATAPYVVGVAIAKDGTLYASNYFQLIRVNSNGATTVIAGGSQPGYGGDDGPATAALLSNASGIIFDQAGNLLVADSGNNRIRRIATDGTITTIAGNGHSSVSIAGPATSTAIGYPIGLILDSDGNLYTGSFLNNQLLKIDTTGQLSIVNSSASTFFLTGPGPVTSARLNPSWEAFDQVGNLYVVDSLIGCIWKVTGGTIQVAAAFAPNFALGDNGSAVLAGLNAPSGVWAAADGSLLIAEQFNQRVRRVSPDGVITTIAGNGVIGVTNPGSALSASLFVPGAVAADSLGNVYLVSGGPVFRVNSSGTLSLFYKGPFHASAIATDSQNNLLVAVGNQIVRVLANGAARVIAGTSQQGFFGDNGPATLASLNGPRGVAADSVGNIYIADTGNSRVRKVTPNGIISTIAGGGASEIDGVAATQSAVSPYSLICDQSGNVFFVEFYNSRVREVSTAGIITTIAGTGTPGFSGDGGLATSATLNEPAGVAVDAVGNVYIADRLNNRIREIVTTVSYNASPTALKFKITDNSLLTETIGLSSAIAGLAFTASTNQPWLTISPTSGTIPAQIQVTVDPNKVPEKPRSSTVTINVPLSKSPSVTIPVSVTGSSGLPPSTISADPGSLNFSFTRGGTAGIAQLTVSTPALIPVSFTAAASTTTGGNWLQISAKGGSVTLSSSAWLMVTANPRSLGVGTYSGAITITDPEGQMLLVPVSMAISAPPAAILLSQLGFTFTAVAQGGTVLPQELGILNIGSGTLHWTASASTMPPASGWLSLSSTSGTVNRPFLDVSSINVVVNASSLVPGTYAGRIQVSAPGASNAPQIASVVLTVLPPGSNPGPDVRPSGLVFTGVAGAETPGAQNFTIANTTANPINFYSGIFSVGGTSQVSYLPANATISPDQPAQIVVQPDFAGLPAGVQRAVLTVAFDDGSPNRTINILSVIAPQGTVSGTATAEEKRSTSACKPAKLIPIFTQVGFLTNVTVGYPATIAAKIVDDCGFPMTSGSVVVSFSNGDPTLSLVNLQDGNWTASWQPNYPSAGTTLTLVAQKSHLLSGTAQALVGVQPSQDIPVLSGPPEGVGTLTAGPFAPGDLILIKGSGLADSQASSHSKPLEQQLAGAQIVVGGTFSPLLYADSNKVVALIPNGIPVNSSQQMLVVRDNLLGLPSPLIIASTHPAILTNDGSGKGLGLIYKVSGGSMVLADANHALHAGDSIIIYCTGLGATDANGNVENRVSLSIGKHTAHMSYAGAALSQNYPPGGPPKLLGFVSAGLGGLYQVNATVPGGISPGKVSVSISSAGQMSQAGVVLPIAEAGH